MQEVEMLEIGGREFHDAKAFVALYRLHESGVRAALAMGMPKPIRVGGRRYFDRERVEQWFLSQVK